MITNVLLNFQWYPQWVLFSSVVSSNRDQRRAGLFHWSQARFLPSYALHPVFALEIAMLMWELWEYHQLWGPELYPYFQTNRNPMLVEMSFSWTWYSRPFCTHFLQRGQSRHSPCQFERTFHSGVALSTTSHPSTWTWIHLLAHSAVHSEDSAIWVQGCSKHSYRHDHIFGLYNLQASPRVVLLSRATNRAGQANILSYLISYMTSAHFFLSLTYPLVI